MEQSKFEEFKKERYQKEITWYDKKAISNQKTYKSLQWILIIFSSITPILIAIDFGLTEHSNLKWIAVITAVIVAISASALRIFKFYDNWISYRNICETLKKEIHLYEAGIDEYSSSNDKEALFVQRVESLISRENSLWVTTHKNKKES